MHLSQLRDQLADLKKKEAIAQTREQILNEDRGRLLTEVEGLYAEIRKLEILPEEKLTPGNLSNVITELQTVVDTELSKMTIPPELA